MSSETEDVSWDTPDRKQAALLADYRESREEVRLEMQFRNKRITQGIAAIGLLVGYGFLAQEPVALAFVPVIVVFVTLLTMVGHRSVLLLGWHVAEIEDELPYETFNWERQYGGATPDNRRNVADHWRQILRGSVLSVGGFIYLGFIAIGYPSVKQAGYPSLIGVPFHDVLACSYVILTSLLIASCLAHYRTKVAIQEQLQTE